MKKKQSTLKLKLKWIIAVFTLPSINTINSNVNIILKQNVVSYDLKGK